MNRCGERQSCLARSGRERGRAYEWRPDTEWQLDAAEEITGSIPAIRE